MTRQELYKKADEYKEKIRIGKIPVELSESQLSEADRYINKLSEEKELILSEELLKNLHQLVVENKELSSYRKTAIKPDWAKYMPPAPEELDHFMKHFIGQMQISKQMFHPIEFAAICHKRILEICPFKSHNEEVAMLMMNLILKHNGYEMISSFEKDEEEYKHKLVAAQHPSSPDIDGFMAFLAKCIVELEEKKCKMLNLI